MIQSDVIKKLALDLALETGTMEDLPIYRKYIQMALVIGIDHFTKDQEEIIALDFKGVEIGRYAGVREAERKLGLVKSSISKVLSGLNYQTGGIRFVRVNEKELIKIPEKVKRELTEVSYLEPAKYRSVK